MALRDMEHDRPRFEQREIAFFIGRNLPERISARCAGCFSALNETHNLVGLADFLDASERVYPAPVRCRHRATVQRR